jgi:hypothetical protein
MNFISADIDLGLSLASMVQLSLPCNSTGMARVEYNVILALFLILLGLNVLINFPVTFRNFDILLSISCWTTEGSEFESR